MVNNLSILYLGPNSKLIEFLKSFGEVTQTEDKLLPEDLSDYDRIISYGYRHILTQKHIDKSINPIINLHISYLPWNRGADPNFWSWVENTPKGVTIHQMDSGIDTGKIYAQSTVEFSDNETLSSSYQKLKDEIETLFMNNFVNIVNNTILCKEQQGKGSFHLSKDKETYNFLLTDGWDTNVKNLTMTDLDIIDAVEAVRTKNNKNWMDILRVAFKHAPEEARPILAEINKSDGQISKLLDKLANNK